MIPESIHSCGSEAYGLHPNYKTLPGQNQLVETQRNIAIVDRISIMEALVLTFLAEYNLPFSMSTSIVGFAKALIQTKMFKGCVCYIFTSLFCIPKGENLWNK